MLKLHNIRKLAYLIAVKHTTNFFDARSTANNIFQGSRAVNDSLVNSFLQDVFKDDLLAKGLNDRNNLTNFKTSFTNWIQAHKSNTVQGLDQYQIDYSAGTTQCFDSFYFRHRHRRFRCYTGEYFYHLKTWISNQVNWSFITDSDPVGKDDAVIISMPFCDTGSLHPDYDSLINCCEQLGVPVLVDCCYYPISGGLDIDVSSTCIDTVAFSLSKAFPIANLRIGVRYTRNIFDGQKLHDSINYNNTLSAYVGLQLIRRFSSDYIYQTYQHKQKTVCDYFELTPGNAVMFAVGDSNWNQYSRRNLLNAYQLNLAPENFNNRVSLVSMFENWDCFLQIQNETEVDI
jgi:hypothetical protein